MAKKTFHILVITLLALNLTGAVALSYAGDCGMECCRPAEWAGTGFPSLEAPSCCDMDGVTCGFRAGNFQELLDNALCSPDKVAFAKHVSGGQSTPVRLFAPSHLLTRTPSIHSTGPPQAVPVYLSNASIIC